MRKKTSKGKLIHQRRKKKKKVNVNKHTHDSLSCSKGEIWGSVKVYMNAYCNKQDGEYTEIYDGMNQNRNPTSAHVTKFHHSKPCWELEQQPW